MQRSMKFLVVWVFWVFLPQFKDMKMRLISHTIFPVVVNVSTKGYLSLSVSAVVNWRLVQGEPHHLPNVSWDWLQPPVK